MARSNSAPLARSSAITGASAARASAATALAALPASRTLQGKTAATVAPSCTPRRFAAASGFFVRLEIMHLTKTKGRRYCAPVSRYELGGDDERDCDARHLSQPHQPVNAALPCVLCVHRISPNS